MQALFAARKREETDGFKDIYRHQAGIEEPIRKECARWACAVHALLVCAKRIWVT